MTKTIQRKKRSKPKVIETVNTDTDSDMNTNLGTNQNVVKVVIQHPKVEPEKPKPKRKARPKVDKAKEEAIDELKEALSEYDKAQNQADALGIKIPMELGVSPIEANQIKNTADILQFVKTIREKIAKIRELKPEGRKLPSAPARINPFLTPPTQMMPTVFPTQPMAPMRPGSGSTPVPPSIPRTQIPQIPLPEIEKGFDDLESALGQSAAENEFRQVVERIEPAIIRIRDEVEQTYLDQNNTLSDTQVRAFKARYELQRNSLIDAFSALSKPEQGKSQPQKDVLEELINRMTNRLGEIERISDMPADERVPEDPVQPPSYQEVNKELDTEAYNRLVRYVKDGRISWKPSLADDLRRLNVPQEEIDDINQFTTSERKEILEIILGLNTDPIPSPKPQPKPQPSPDPTNPRARLINYVNDEDIDWSPALLEDLKEAGGSVEVQNAVSEASLENEKRDIIRKFLGIGPAPEKIPGMAVFKEALARFYQTYNRILGSYQTSAPEERAGLIQDIRTKNDVVDKVANTGGAGGTPIVPPTVAEQLAFEKQTEDASAKAEDLIEKIQAMGTPSPTPSPFVPGHSDILNREPTNPTEAFALLKAYVSQPEAPFTDFVGQALDLTFQGEREKVQMQPSEPLRKARVRKLLIDDGIVLAPGDDPGGQPGPPPFRPSDPLDPSNLGPGRRNMRRDMF